MFSRKRGGQRREAEPEEPSPAGGGAARSGPRTTPRRPPSQPTKSSGTGRPALESGPYDVSEAPEGVELVDLGALRIPVVEGVELRVQADPEGRVQQVVLVAEEAESALQLGVFAAPRTEQVWDEAREQLRAQLRSDGFTSREADGEFGTELLARVRTPDGMAEIRFVGISGPRWLVRGVFQGAAATEQDAAPELKRCLRGLVVDRGWEALPVHEALPLRLPKEAAESVRRHSAGQTEADGAEAAQSEAEVPGSQHDGRRPARRR